jgi:hypothetical protein
MSEHITNKQIPGYCRGTCSDEQSQTILKHLSICKTCFDKVEKYEEKYSPVKKCGSVELCLGRRTPLCYECNNSSEFVTDICQLEAPEGDDLDGQELIPYVHSPKSVGVSKSRFLMSMLSDHFDKDQGLNLPDPEDDCQDYDPHSAECRQCPQGRIYDGKPIIDIKKIPKKGKKSPNKKKDKGPKDQ